jgi:hypothetical protein
MQAGSEKSSSPPPPPAARKNRVLPHDNSWENGDAEEPIEAVSKLVAKSAQSTRIRPTETHSALAQHQEDADEEVEWEDVDEVEYEDED